LDRPKGMATVVKHFSTSTTLHSLRLGFESLMDPDERMREF
jgi:hypothetical protein